MKSSQVKPSVALALCLALLLTACLFQAAGADGKGPVPRLTSPSPRHLAPWSLRLPLPTFAYMHARVATGGSMLPVYGNSLLQGEPVGQLRDGDITAVEIYTQGVGRVIGSSAALFGGFVRLSRLEEIPDENYASYEEVFRAVILADPATGGPVHVWRNYDLSGEIIGAAMPGEVVTARDDESGYSAEITLPSGLTGFIAPEQLEYMGPAGD